MAKTQQKCKALFRDVARDIIMMDILSGDSFQDLYDKFFKILRKHNIKQCTKLKNGGSVGDNFEYTGAKEIFKMQIKAKLEWNEFADIKYPKDIYNC